MNHNQMRRKNQAQLRGQIIQSKRDLEREQNIMNSPVADLLGKGEGEIVRKLLDMKADMPATEWIEMALLMQKLIRGPASLLLNQDSPEVAEHIQALRAKAVKEDKAMEAWKKDPEKFTEEVFDQSEKLIRSERTRDQLIAQGVQMYQEAKNNAVASQANKRLRMLDALKNGPKETINVVGRVETVMMNGQPQARVAPVSISLAGGFEYVLQPGTQTVPIPIAQRYHEIERTRAEMEARESAMSANMEQGKLNQQLLKIDRDFKTKSEPLPLA